MEITEVKVRLADNHAERLRGFCTITLDGEFVVRDIKIIDGANGLFVAMPSRKVTDHCPKCRGKNHLRARYCNDCGAPLPGQRMPNPSEAGSKLHVDVAHPINSDCRARFQKAILEAFEAERRRVGQVADTAPPPDDAHSAPEEEEPSPQEHPPHKSFGEGIV